MLTTNPLQKTTIDDLLYFFRSTVQMTSDGKKEKKTSSSYFLWSQVMTHLHSLLFYFYVYLYYTYSVGFQISQKHVQS